MSMSNKDGRANSLACAVFPNSCWIEISRNKNKVEFGWQRNDDETRYELCKSVQ